LTARARQADAANVSPQSGIGINYLRVPLAHRISLRRISTRMTTIRRAAPTSFNSSFPSATTRRTSFRDCNRPSNLIQAWVCLPVRGARPPG
jgi:hypothetical protein